MSLGLSTSVAYADTIAVVPIIISPPGLNGPTGPGMQAIWSTDFIGPLQLGSTWEVDIFPPAPSELLQQHWVYPATTPGAIFTLGIQDNALAVSHGQSFLPHAAPGRMVVRLKDPLGAVIDQGAQTITYDTQTGLPFLLTKTAGGTTDGSFTEADRLMMGNIELATYSTISSTTIGGAAVSLAINQLLKGPPTDFLAQSPSFLLSGRGSVNRPGNGASLLAYGYRWFLESAPAGLGKENGYVVEYEQRLVQFALVRERLGGGEYVAQLENAHMESAEATWGLPFPLRVEYDILPGVVIRFAWLLLAQ